MTLVLLGGYLFSLWWLLRRESPVTLLFVALVCSAALAIRVAHAGNYPAGLHEDEPKLLACVTHNLLRGDLWGKDCTGLPNLLTAVFQPQLVPFFGDSPWTIRTYSLVTSVLSCAAGFAAARAMGLRVAAGLAVAGLLAVLPWSIFWGRVIMGGELPFHQLLLLAALARILWAGGGFVEMLIGGFGLCLLLYDYFGARSMLAMPFVGAVLARGWRRFACLAMFPLAILGWMAHTGPDVIGAFSWIVAERFDRSYITGDPVQVMVARVLRAARVFVEAKGIDSALTVDAAGIHPRWLLIVALAGSFTGIRRALFLWGGFVAGLVPELLSRGDNASVHRMMMSFPFVTLAAGAAIDLLPWRWPRSAATASVVLVAGFQSVSLYFSDRFWSEAAKNVFEWSKPAAIASLPLEHPRAIFARSYGYYLGPRGLIDPGLETLTVETFYPPNGRSIYFFGWHERLLLPFYQNLFGPERIRVFGSSFVLHLEDRDWRWLRESGWNFEARCGEQVYRDQVPALFSVHLPVPALRCGAWGRTNIWRARWNGPSRLLNLRYSGTARVEVDAKPAASGSGFEQTLEFAVQTGSDVLVQVGIDTPGLDVSAELTETTRAGNRIPTWGTVTPLEPPAASAAPAG